MKNNVLIPHWTGDVSCIWFLIQSQNDAENFKALVDLQDFSADRVEVIFVHLDHYTHQNTLLPLKWLEANKIQVLAPRGEDFDDAIYRASIIERFRMALRARSALTVAGSTIPTHVVIGNDGILQRAILSELGVPPDRIHILYDGLLTPNVDRLASKVHSLLRMVLEKLASLAGYQFLVNRGLCHSKAAEILVMHESVRREFKARGVSTPIHVGRMPRLESQLLRVVPDKKKKKFPRPLNILYATTAYSWHGYKQLGSNQISDVNLLDTVLGNADLDLNLRIRFHPRDEHKRYSLVHFQPTTNLSSWQDVYWADILICSRSTLAFEAQMLDTTVYFFSRSIACIPGSFWDIDTSILKLSHADELLRCLNRVVSTGVAKEV